MEGIPIEDSIESQEDVLHPLAEAEGVRCRKFLAKKLLKMVERVFLKNILLLGLKKLAK